MTGTSHRSQPNDSFERGECVSRVKLGTHLASRDFHAPYRKITRFHVASPI